MNFGLTDEQRLLRETVREFARAEVAPVAAELDAAKSFPYAIIAKLGELGLMGIPFPEEFGGGGADTLSYALAVEELARVDSSVCITMAAHTSLGTMPIYLWGRAEQKADWLPRLCRGERLASFGLTEPEAGSDAANVRTTAKLEDGEWVVNGAKQFITNAGTEISGCVAITAVTGVDQEGRKEVSNILIPTGTPGYEVGEAYRKMGWNASDTRPLSFADCRVPESALLGRRGAGLKNFLAILDGGRIGVAAMAVGLAQGALDEAISYAKERQAFGRPISKFQTIRAKIADLSAQIEAARLLTWRAALEKDAGKPFTLTAAQAKLITGRLAVRAADEAVQIHGGYGYIEEYPVCRFYRDAKILTIGEGTDEVQQMVIARELGVLTPTAVKIREVGPRDGFQNEPEVISTDDKVHLVELLAQTGVRRLEVTSFVRADVVPQLADGGEVLRRAEIPDSVAVSVLVPNERGLETALAHRDRIGEVNVFLSVSESHNRHNVNRSVEESLSGIERMLALARAENLRCEGVISTSFGCPYEGDIDPARVFEIASRLAAAGAAEVGFGDTTGMANPRQVRGFFERAAEELPELELTAHFHNTRGQGLANVLAALQAGCASFESSVGELGGCPVPPGATGNIASEDLVSMLEEMGIATGIDLDRMIAAARETQRVLGRRLGSQTLLAGPVEHRC